MGGETVLLNGRAIARLTSAAFGYTVGHALGLAYLPRDLSANGLDLEVQLLASRVKARVLDTAPYDPSSARLKS
jgi:glycine cleavage system aminomethyltransferase T